MQRRWMGISGWQVEKDAIMRWYASRVQLFTKVDTSRLPSFTLNREIRRYVDSCVDVRTAAVRRLESFRRKCTGLMLGKRTVRTIAIAEDRVVPKSLSYRVRALYSDPGNSSTETLP